MPLEPFDYTTKKFPPNAYENAQEVVPWLGRFGQKIKAKFGGRYMDLMVRGSVFSAATDQAGVNIPISTTTAPTFLLWNPSDSGKVVVPIAFRVGYASFTTTAAVAAAIGYMGVRNAGGGSSGTSVAITAFTDVTSTQVFAGLVGSPYRPAARLATTATIVAANATFLRSASMSQGAPITTTAAMYTLTDIFEGAIGLRPGTAIFPAALVAPVTITQLSMDFLEIPV